MSFKAAWFRDRLRKKVRQGFQGYPVATVSYYGPDDQTASKVAVGILLIEGGEVAFLERWYSQGGDIRLDPDVNEAIVHFIQQHGVRSVISPDRIIGCPHEEGTDYPDGEKCPTCGFWATRDRYTGEIIQ